MIYCSLLLVEGESTFDQRGRRELFFKEVNWPCVPIGNSIDNRVMLGRDERGEETGWSLIPKHVWFNVNSDILVELEDSFRSNDPEESIDKYIQYVRNDGFVDHEEWHRLHD